MDKNEKDQGPRCGKPEPILFAENAKGIVAPTETAKPYMAEDGFVESDKTMGDE